MSGDVLDGKLDFLHCKNIVLGKSEKLHFSTGVSPCFQWEFFHPSFLGKKRSKIVEVFRDVT